MKGRGVGVAIGVLALALGSALAAPAAAARADEVGARSSSTVDRFDTVVLDAGHGGDDHGAEGASGLREKDLVLDVVRRLRARLEKDSLRVVLTRDGDAYVPLQERTAIANRAGGDLFVSVHANAAHARAARGIEIFFAALEASDEATRQLAERENAAFREAAPTDDDPLASILGDLAEADQMRESDEFARFAHQRVASIDADVPSRGVKQAPFVVLMGVQMPAALVEIGFITNPKEERELADDDHRERVAEALASAITDFASRYDARRGVERGASGRGDM